MYRLFGRRTATPPVTVPLETDATSAAEPEAIQYPRTTQSQSRLADALEPSWLRVRFLYPFCCRLIAADSAHTAEAYLL